MNLKTIAAFALPALLAAVPATAADTEDELVCATRDVHVCKLYEDCREIQPSEANVPDFWKIDLKKKEITARRHDGSYGSVKIRSRQDLADMIVLQGVEDTTENFAEGIGWTISIHDDTGRMSIAVSAHEEVVSLLGSCHAL